MICSCDTSPEAALEGSAPPFPRPLQGADGAVPAIWRAILLFIFLSCIVEGAPPEEARQQLIRGEYGTVAAQAADGISGNPKNEEWRLLLVEAQTAGGQYREAAETVKKAVADFPFSLRLCLLGHRVLRQNGDAEGAKELLSQMDRLGGTRDWAYREPANRVALGQAALLVGADPKRVLELFFDPVKKAAPEFRDVWIASGQLALDKGDSALAVKLFSQAAKRFPDDPDVQFGLAQAFAPSDTPAMLAALEKTLAVNPHHVGARLLLAEQHIDAERYDEAVAALREALQTDPARPEAHALLAVLAEIREDQKGAGAARAEALKFWPANPAVDHLIGRKLSQKYRFSEGAERQRQALKADPDYLPAKIQLAQDLLRLGENEAGWKLADEVQKADPYDVLAFNLVALRESTANFQTLTSPHFLLRMEPREAGIYGDQALALLERAYSVLGEKYGLKPKQQTVVEIFPEQKDFAIRTFGMPGGGGYLGVCFGRVITANSPASRPGSPSNWESVLWHEYCHVVTLQLTRNKMPRWLSEGISVFEERQARGSGGNVSGTWGEKMNPRHRAMILGDDLTPVSELSGAFLKPKTPAHLMFAYFESSLVVEYLVERFGLEKLKRILADLGRGVPINTAIAAHAAPIAEIDAQFAEHARALARGTGPALDWTKPAPAQLASDSAVDAFIAANPNNFTALTEQAKKLVAARQWEEAKAPLEKLIALYPNQHDPDGAFAMLARVHRELGETDAELASLTRLTELSSDATDAFERLMDLAAAQKDWPAVLVNAERLVAVNPFSPAPYRWQGEAFEACGRKPPAATAYQKLLDLNPPDAPEIHFRLARLLAGEDAARAKRHVLLALEEAPRFQEALRLLLTLDEHSPTSKSNAPGRAKKP